MTLGGVADNGIGILQQCQGQHQRDDQADEIAADDQGHQRTNGNNHQRIGVERVAEESTDPVPEWHGLRGGTEIAHGTAAVGAQGVLFSSVRIRHATGAVVYLAVTAMPFCGFAGVVMAVVFH